MRVAVRVHVYVCLSACDSGGSSGGERLKLILGSVSGPDPFSSENLGPKSSNETAPTLVGLFFNTNISTISAVLVSLRMVHHPRNIC